MSDRIVTRKDGHIAWLTFNRLERLNAMTIETGDEFDDEVASLDATLNLEIEAVVQAHMTRDNREARRRSSTNLTPCSVANESE